MSQVRLFVRTDKQAGLQPVPAHRVDVQSLRLHREVNAVHVQRVPFHELLERRLIRREEIRHGQSALELQPWRVRFRWLPEHLPRHGERAADEAKLQVRLEVRLQRAQINGGHPQFQVCGLRSQARRAAQCDQSAFVDPHRQRGADRLVAHSAQSFHV